MAVETRRLGLSPVEVTSVGLGTVPLAGFGTDTPYAVFEAVVQRAFDLGVRYFDTAPMYGFGKAEHYLGHALRVNALRDSVVLSTKVARLLKPASRTERLVTPCDITWHGALPFLDQYDYTYDGVMRSFEDSQQRLGIDGVDVLLVHDVGTAWHGDRSEFYWNQLRQSGYRALDELRSSGAVKALGLGVNETASVVGVAREFNIDCALIAGRYTLLNHAPLEADFDELARRNVSVIAGGVFNSGILAAGTKAALGTYDYGKVPPDILKRVSHIEELCALHRVSLAAAAIQFVKAHPAVATVVLGARNATEIEENVAAASLQIPYAFWEDLRKSGLVPQHAPLPGATK